MKIIKRSGAEETFNIDKIIAAIGKANKEVATINRMSEEQVSEIAQNVTYVLIWTGHLMLKKYKTLLKTR